MGETSGHKKRKQIKTTSHQMSLHAAADEFDTLLQYEIRQ